MRLIQVRHRILRYTYSDLTGFQVLTKEWRLFGVLPVWTRWKDREDVPSWAVIQRACLGSTDWESRLFREHGYLLDD